MRVRHFLSLALLVGAGSFLLTSCIGVQLPYPGYDGPITLDDEVWLKCHNKLGIPLRCTEFRSFEEAMEHVHRGGSARRRAWFEPFDNGCQGVAGTASVHIPYGSTEVVKTPFKGADEPFVPTIADLAGFDWEADC